MDFPTKEETRHGEKTEKGEQTMNNDTISRQAAIDILKFDEEVLNRVLDDTDVVGSERTQYELELGLIESYIYDMEELPSAQPEIIRCKDCKWYNMGECEHKLGLFVANDENYCSYAERRAGDDIR